MENTDNNFWDPLGETINQDSFSQKQQKEIQKANWYKNHPRFFLLSLFACFIPPLLSLPIIIYVDIFHNTMGLCLLGASFLPLALYYFSITSLQRDLLNLYLCQKNNWVYDGDSNLSRTGLLMAFYPDLFNVGRGQMISEQMWGLFKPKSIPFWKCRFQYTVGSGKSSHTYVRSVLLLKLPQPVPIAFTLAKESFLTRFLDDIKTESDEFNKTFHVYYDQSDSSTKTQVMRVLSPSVLVRLVDYSKKYPVTSLSFIGDILVLVIDGNLWNPQYTNFFNVADLDERDETLFYTTLSDVLTIPSEMLQFLQ